VSQREAAADEATTADADFGFYGSASFHQESTTDITEEPLVHMPVGVQNDVACDANDDIDDTGALILEPQQSYPPALQPPTITPTCNNGTHFHRSLFAFDSRVLRRNVPGERQGRLVPHNSLPALAYTSPLLPTPLVLQCGFGAARAVTVCADLAATVAALNLLFVHPDVVKAAEALPPPIDTPILSVSDNVMERLRAVALFGLEKPCYLRLMHLHCAIMKYTATAPAWLGSPRQFVDALDPRAALKVMLVSAKSVSDVYDAAHALTFPMDSPTSYADLTIICRPQCVTDNAVNTGIIEQSIRERFAQSGNAPINNPAVMTVYLLRASDPSTSENIRNAPFLMYPADVPLNVTFAGAGGDIASYALAVVVLASSGTRTHPKYEVLRRNNNDYDGWFYIPHVGEQQQIDTVTVTSMLASVRDGHTHATALIFLPRAQFSRDTVVASDSSRSRERKLRRLNKERSLFSHQQNRNETGVISLRYKSCDSSCLGFNADMCLMSAIYEFTVLNPAMPEEFSEADAIRRIDTGWRSFVNFFTKSLAPTWTSPFDLNLYLDFATRYTGVTGEFVVIDTAFKSQTLTFILTKTSFFSPIQRLNDALQKLADDGDRPRKLVASQDAFAASFVVEIVLIAKFTCQQPRLPAAAHRPGTTEYFRGYGFASSRSQVALRRAYEAACYSMFRRLMVLARPSKFSKIALWSPTRPIDVTSAGAVAETSCDGGILVGGQRNWTRWTNWFSTLLAHCPSEQKFHSSFADFVLQNGRTLELQSNATISLETIATRRANHAIEGAGDPIWWLLATTFMCKSSDLRSDNSAYGLHARAGDDLLLLSSFACAKARKLLEAMGPDVYLDMGHQNVVLQLVRYVNPYMWVRVTPLFPLLLRLGALDYYASAYGGAPRLDSRIDAVSYADLAELDDGTPVLLYTHALGAEHGWPPPPRKTPPPAAAPLSENITTEDRACFAKVSQTRLCLGGEKQLNATITGYTPAHGLVEAQYRVDFTDGGQTSSTPSAWLTLHADKPNQTPLVVQFTSSLSLLPSNPKSNCAECGRKARSPIQLLVCAGCASTVHVSCVLVHAGADTLPTLTNQVWVCAMCVPPRGGIIATSVHVIADLSMPQSSSDTRFPFGLIA